MFPNLTRPLAGIRSTLVLIMATLTGCTTVGPDFQQPETKTAENWLEATDARVDTANVEYEDWWSIFDDPVLAALIDKAYRQNLGLQVAGLRILEARAQLGFAVGTRR